MKIQLFTNIVMCLVLSACLSTSPRPLGDDALKNYAHGRDISYQSSEYQQVFRACEQESRRKARLEFEEAMGDKSSPIPLKLKDRGFYEAAAFNINQNQCLNANGYPRSQL